MRHHSKVYHRNNPCLGQEGSLPNVASIHQTPASLYIDIHYHQLELKSRWTWERYLRLCNIMKMTPYEMGSLLMMRHTIVSQYERQKRLPAHIARMASLLLTMMEFHVLGSASHDVINPIPDINKVFGTSTQKAQQTNPPSDALPGNPS